MRHYAASVATVTDRVVQASLKLVLEPVFEADFLPASFGFRPGRSPQDALQVLTDECARGRRWVVETDIANCFSAIPHDKLMQAVEERISDQAVLTLLRAMLRAGVMEGGQVCVDYVGQALAFHVQAAEVEGFSKIPDNAVGVVMVPGQIAVSPENGMVG